jgi:hypothetical protein
LVVAGVVEAGFVVEVALVPLAGFAVVLALGSFVVVAGALESVLGAVVLACALTAKTATAIDNVKKILFMAF